MKKLTKEQVEEAIYQEWQNCHHNAYITYPDIQNEYESDLFWACLGDAVSIWIDDLKGLILEKYGYNWDFYQYGRMGATIAPDKCMKSVGGGGFGGFRYEAMPESYSDMVNMLHALQAVNRYWRKTALDIPEWWKETKEANELQKDIDEHDGMRKIMVEKWVK